MSLASSRARPGRIITVATAALAVLTVAALVATGSTRADAASRPQRPPLQTFGSVLGSLSAAMKPGVGQMTAPVEPGRTAPVPVASGAFVYRNGSYAPLGVIPGAAALGDEPGFPDATTFSFHQAINDSGQIAGTYGDSLPGPDGSAPPGSIHGFVQHQRGDITRFDIPGAAGLVVEGNDDRGQVVGEYYGRDAVPGPNGLAPAGSIHGFVRQPDGQITTLDLPFAYLHAVRDINDHGQIAGYYFDPGKPYNFGGGFLGEPDGQVIPVDVPGAGGFTFPFSINDRGQVAGWYAEQGTTLNPDGSIPPSKVHGFVWDHGKVTRIDVPGAAGTFAYGINNSGQIAGSYQDASGEHGFLLTGGTATTLNAPGRTYTDAVGINDRGEVLITEGTSRSYQVAAG